VGGSENGILTTTPDSTWSVSNVRVDEEKPGVVTIDSESPRPGAGERPEGGEHRPQPTVSVVIPTLNEAGNLPYVLNTIPSWVDEVVIVDGRSADDTLRIAQDLEPGIRIIKETTPGKGAAMRAGFAAATSDFIVALDADGSMDGAEIGKFRDALAAGADYVKGSRFAQGGGSADITAFRRFGDMGICFLIRMMFGAHYTDATYGYVGVRADSVDKLGIDSNGFEVETLIGIRAHRAGLRTTEVPCFEAKRIHGKSNLHAARDGMRILNLIVRERLRRNGHAKS
jgi:glycosyltransferase involved in cell wall biosynthesis